MMGASCVFVGVVSKQHVGSMTGNLHYYATKLVSIPTECLFLSITFFFDIIYLK